MAQDLTHDARIRQLEGFHEGPNFIEVVCGCTKPRFGDKYGTLRVLASGEFVIFCKSCRDRGINCGGRYIPEAFERHAEREGNRDWSKFIWVRKDGKRLPLKRSGLLDYYKIQANGDNASRVAARKRKFHRDEFLKCSVCEKERRFRLRNSVQVRAYHAALMNKDWRCTDYPYEKISCETAEERKSRKGYRGCRNGKCDGCTKCVCFGCLKCRFLECNCRDCKDFVGGAVV